MEQKSFIAVDFSMVIQIINFLIMVYVFYKLFSKKIGGVIEERKNIATKQLEEVKLERTKIELEKEKAEKLKIESKKRANDIIIKAEIQADTRRETILKHAKENKERMLTNAETEIIKMKAKAEIELQRKIKSIAATMAEKLLKENISKDAELKTKSVDSFIDEIGE